jgi:hypothetical protein
MDVWMVVWSQVFGMDFGGKDCCGKVPLASRVRVVDCLAGFALDTRYHVIILFLAG